MAGKGKTSNYHRPIRRRRIEERRGGGCAGCGWQLLIYLILIGSLCTMLYRGLKDRGQLPGWARLSNLPGIPERWPWEPDDDDPIEVDATFWMGFPGADLTYRSPNFRPGRREDITSIVLHCTEGARARSAINHFLKRSSQVSAHYIVDRDGHLYQMVDERNQAWHCRGANNHTIGIEIAAEMHQSISRAQTGTLIALLQDLMDRHEIPRREITGHDFTPRYRGSTTCPDQLFGGNRPHHLDAWLKVNLDPLLRSAP